MRWFVDVDGVLAGFPEAVLKLNNLPGDACLIKKWNGLHEAIGISMEDMWKGIAWEGQSFWADMSLYPWATPLLGLIEFLDDDSDVMLCTAAARDPESYAGKIRWVQRNLPAYDKQGRVIITRRKEYLAHSKDHILIDDRPRNVKRWIEAGGTGILFPRPYNGGGEDIYVLDKFITAMESAM